MAEVHVLDELTAKQIAAGEVIERPVSVVKELVENALDAGANLIKTEIRQGGLELVRVSDNGCGMSEKDAALAIKRHATSKIRCLDDLNRLYTLGFRGEALPSIISVARTEVITRERTSHYGTKLICEGGRVLSVEPAGAPVGTAITVRDVFFNTPARKKFMRTPGYESSLIHELLIHFALSHPQVSFILVSDGKEILNTTGINDLQELMPHFYGKEVTDALIPLEWESTSGSINGYITSPSYYRTNRRGILLFVNNRKVLSKELLKAIEKAFENILPKGRFPLAVLNLSVEPSLIDVNVHPSKLEVRFRDSGIIQETASSIQNSLNTHKKAPLFELRDNVSRVAEQNEQYPADRPGRKTEEKLNIKPLFGQESWKESWKEFTPRKEATADQNTVAADLNAAFETSAREPVTMPGSEPFESLRVIGQLAATFILAEGDDGLYLFDQHAAHERVLFEQLTEQARQGALQSQVLLAPASIHLTPLEEETVINSILPLTGLGIVLEHFGPRTYLLRALPSCVRENPQDFFFSLLKEFMQEAGNTSSLNIRQKFIILTSCKSAIKANQKLPAEALTKLILDLKTTKNPLTCPHGRPTLYKISYQEILKAFKRSG